MPFTPGVFIAPTIQTVERQAIATNIVLIPFTQRIKLLWAHVAFVSSAVVGNRQFEIAVTNSANLNILDTNAGAVQTAGLTNHYMALQGIYRETGFTASEIQLPIPIDCYILNGQKLKFSDKNNIDPVGDSMIISYSYMVQQ